MFIYYIYILCLFQELREAYIALESPYKNKFGERATGSKSPSKLLAEGRFKLNIFPTISHNEP